MLTKWAIPVMEQGECDWTRKCRNWLSAGMVDWQRQPTTEWVTQEKQFYITHGWVRNCLRSVLVDYDRVPWGSVLSYEPLTIQGEFVVWNRARESSVRWGQEVGEACSRGHQPPTYVWLCPYQSVSRAEEAQVVVTTSPAAAVLRHSRNTHVLSGL